MDQPRRTEATGSPPSYESTLQQKPSTSSTSINNDDDYSTHVRRPEPPSRDQRVALPLPRPSPQALAAAEVINQQRRRMAPERYIRQRTKPCYLVYLIIAAVIAALTILFVLYVKFVKSRI